MTPTHLRLVHDTQPVVELDTFGAITALGDVGKALKDAADAVDRAHQLFALPGHAGLYLPDEGTLALDCQLALQTADAAIRRLRVAYANAEKVG